MSPLPDCEPGAQEFISVFLKLGTQWVLDDYCPARPRTDRWIDGSLGSFAHKIRQEDERQLLLFARGRF